MRIVLLLHSVTGNTDLVARHVQRHLAAGGHRVRLVDIRLEPDPKQLEDFDLLGVASPTMYFRASFVMDKYLRGLIAPEKPRPAFLLATAAGEPGAHFEGQAVILDARGYRTLGAHWVTAPSTWPPQRVVSLPMGLGKGLGRGLARMLPSFRPLLGLLWPDCPEPQNEDKEALESFLGRMLTSAERGDSEALMQPLYKPWLPGAAAAGRRMTPNQASKATATRIDEKRCSRCGGCVQVCPVECITWPEGQPVPQVGFNCVGCWACYHRCPTGAVAGWLSPGGLGQYPGPPEGMRRIFGRN